MTREDLEDAIDSLARMQGGDHSLMHRRCTRCPYAMWYAARTCMRCGAPLHSPAWGDYKVINAMVWQYEQRSR